MNIQMLSYNNNTSFQGRLTPETRRCMNEVLLPLVNNFVSPQEMSKQTIYTLSQINDWSLRRFGMTISKLYKQRQSIKLKGEFLEHRKNQTLLKDMTKIYGHNARWIKRQYKQMGIAPIQSEQSKLMDENIPWMLDAGYTLEMMKSELKVSFNKITGWLWKHFDCGISEYRRTHNLHIKKNR